MRNAAYEGLFYELARTHNLIRHQDAAPRFARIIVSVDPMQKLADLAEMEETLLGRYLRPESGQQVLVLESLQSQVQDNQGDNQQLRRRGAFFVLQQAEHARDAWRILDQTETTGEQLLGAVRHQLQDTPKIRLVLGSIALDAIGPIGDGTWYGTRFDFEFSTPATRALSYDPAAFTVI
ncbi:MAG: hypothetical protein ACRYF0_16590 [Janthinobacterium lividum]